jgi:hypothetical protein
MVSFVSGVPLPVFLLAYPAAVGLTLLIRLRIWQVPLLSMLLVTFFSTLLLHTLTYIALRLAGTALPLGETINLITLPSLLLNLLLAVPFMTIFGDLANLLYPQPLEV